MKRDDAHSYFERPQGDLFLPEDHPIRSTLDRLCSEAKSFETGEAMEAAGFYWPHRFAARGFWDRANFCHRDLPGWELRGAPWAESPISWYYFAAGQDGQVVRMRREVAAVAEEKGWNRIVVPETWIYSPPWGVGKYILRVTKRLSLLTSEESRLGYDQMEEEVMRQILEMVAMVEFPFEEPRSLPLLENGDVLFRLEGKPDSRLDGFALTFLPHLKPDIAQKARAYWTEVLLEKERQWPAQTISESLKRRMDPFLLSTESEEGRALAKICTGPEIFVDRETMKGAGFELLGSSGRQHSFQIMVARHPDLPGYVIKSFPLLGDKVHPYKRLSGYVKRCEQAKRLRDYARDHRFRYMNAVAKGIFQLPSNFTSERAPDGKFLLVAEEAEHLSKKEAEQWLSRMPKRALKELLLFYRDFGLSDSSWYNHPVTRGHEILWIDTEHLGTGNTDELPEAVRRIVGDDLWPSALELWEKLK